MNTRFEKFRNCFAAVCSFALTVSLGAIASAEIPQVDNPNLNKPGAMTHGFKLVRTVPVTEINSEARFFEHVQSGAELLYLSCDDDNKVFSIGFRTPPADNTGIAHILEHSVLCGSRKFPSKEPFVDLLKGSLQTFLNAFTANDRTIYPVASQNDKDFRNLMDVYLDAVFYPNMKTVPEILMQEGWHYQVDEESGELRYNGIVYNEMKGVYSSPSSLFYRVIEKTLFADGTYGNDSGGDPDDIPNLTQKQFVEFHDKYYHPGNSMIFLYGNGNIEEHLEFIDKEYLSGFKKADIDTKIIKQPRFVKPKEVIEEYSINPGDSAEDKTFLSLNYIVCDGPDAELHYAMDMLSYILLDSDSAPLRRALLDAGIGLDVGGQFDSSILQPYFSIIVRNSNPEMMKPFEETVEKTLKEIIENGLDPKLVEAAVNRTEFSLREFQIPRFPKGLAINMQILSSWSYKADPLMYLQYEPILQKIKSGAEKGGYFEALIKEHLLGNSSRAMVVMKPKEGLDIETNEALEAKLAEIKASMSEKELSDIAAEQVKLIERQASPDKPEDVAKIPVLQLSDIDREAKTVPCKEFQIAGTTVLNHDLHTNQVVYLTFYFDAETLPNKLVPYGSLLSSLLSRLDTENSTYCEFSNETDINTGGIYTGFSPVSDKTELGVFYPKFTVRTKVMLPKLENSLDLMGEMIFKTKFEDKARIKELILEERSGLEQSLMSAGHSYSQLRAASYISPVHAYRELIGGIEYYRFLCSLEDDFDAKADELIANLKETSKLVFHRENLLGSVTLPETDFKASEAIIAKFIETIPDTKYPKQKFAFTPDVKNEGVLIPSRVQYVCKAGNYREAGGKYSGSMKILTNVLRTGYLWNQIRVLGGAYGSGFAPERTGILSFWSYRDPHLDRTVGIYDGVADYLENLELEESEMTKAIISTIGDLDKPLTPSEKGALATGRYIIGMSHEEVQKERDEVLGTKLKDLKAFGPILRKTMEQDVICVFGSEPKIEENKKLFKNVIKIKP